MTDENPALALQLARFMTLYDAADVLAALKPPNYETAAAYLQGIADHLMRDAGVPGDFLQAMIASRPPMEAQAIQAAYEAILATRGETRYDNAKEQARAAVEAAVPYIAAGARKGAMAGLERAAASAGSAAGPVEIIPLEPKSRGYEHREQP